MKPPQLWVLMAPDGVLSERSLGSYEIKLRAISKAIRQMTTPQISRWSRLFSGALDMMGSSGFDDVGQHHRMGLEFCPKKASKGLADFFLYRGVIGASLSIAGGQRLQQHLLGVLQDLFAFFAAH